MFELLCRIVKEFTTEMQSLEWTVCFGTSANGEAVIFSIVDKDKHCVSRMVCTLCDPLVVKAECDIAKRLLKEMAH